ncbi:hypothetical protein C1645_870402 [Glomus cerebriforme]|uniref:F-box domain-containing protein n=1 Tax=Glomus cerebriforme TaxID=658196 RepID=A0A397TPE6_9GLOM|nr:hypothetical protein C1645_870402 [Glomus cerebriforme]
MFKLSVDCLNEILEYLEDDMVNLHSCLIVNALWCKISVRIFWRNVYNYKTSNYRTLIACLPNESKEILYNNGITISTPTSRPPMFNYAAFCKVLSIDKVNYDLELLLYNEQIYTQSELSDNAFIVTQEIVKLYLNQITSLKYLHLREYPIEINLNLYPEAKVCLKNLTELQCNSNFSSEFFYQLSQICYNISILDIMAIEIISEGLTDLISVQKNLQSFIIIQFREMTDLTPFMEKLPNTLIRLNILKYNFISLYFITRFTNLQELRLYFYYEEYFIDFEKLQYSIFPNLQILKIQCKCPRFELLIKFLENNGKNLKECYIGDFYGDSDNSLNLAIAKFCPNIRRLSAGFKNNELETMKIVFNCCQYLEGFIIWRGRDFLNEKEVLETIVKYSPKNFYEIIFQHINIIYSVLIPEELESFFINWTNRVPQKSLSLVIVNDGSNSLDTSDGNIEIINKYIELGVIKKFEIYENFENEL